ncbi:hypothetical protein RF679_04370 [Undibacterium cyanobacteriorum]|uniref:Secreted protein n=1 Tax=Undibacterium cyanobacteriorum TaxID=3073561 RepID=A0ABY9RML5_9BURK|nr:hypothetical protein [Undibacterium sp. 20NA77.5]WMW81520.1 hypothetical protein RF679_04370 [Undibacterium sp. 20NA77.5]
MVFGFWFLVFGFAVDFEVNPLLTLPIVLDRKWIKKALLFEPQASFKAFPFFALRNWEAEGQRQRGRLFWVTFFGETKKVTSCRATPDLRTLNLTNRQKERKPLDSHLRRNDKHKERKE